MKRIFLTYADSIKLMKKWSEENPRWEPEKHRLVLIREAPFSSWSFRYPALFPENRSSSLPEYINGIDRNHPRYLLLLIQAGYAALGVFEQDKLILHKRIQKYMVRKKRGKAQITYLQQKGKSRAGSRIRLRESVEFFEEINGKLRAWGQEVEEARRIFVSCPVRLWGEVFRSKVEPPFGKKDERIQKVPFDVRVPSHEELYRIHGLLKLGILERVGEN